MSKTNFELVQNLNNVAGNETSGDWNRLIDQWKYVLLEVKEANDNINAGNWAGLRDDLPDILVTTYGMAHIAGFNSDIDMIDVIEALFTRFDRTPEDAILTKEKYLKIGVETYTSEREVEGKIYYVTKSSKDQTGSDDEFYPNDKFLKSHRFRREVFKQLPAEIEQKLNETAKPLEVPLKLEI